jgi:predicted secreted protein
MTDDAIIIVNKHSNGKEFKDRVGDVIQIELESLGSAGYKWFIGNLDVNYLVLISEETKATGDKEKIGAPVRSIWRFRLLQKGLTDIKMSRYRVWEGKEKASDNFQIKLNIH